MAEIQQKKLLVDDTLKLVNDYGNTLIVCFNQLLCTL